MSLVGVAAQAATVTGVNTSIAPNGPASVVFDFDFGAPITLEAFNATLSFDSTKLTLVDPTNFASANSGVLTSDFSQVVAFSSPNSATISLVGPPNVGLDSKVQVQFNFLTQLKAGESSVVKLDLTYAEPSGLDVTLPTASATVAAVPEPVTWALMLAGVGVVGAFGRRKA
ncbi:MAG: PEP-CTERM sorting domain-containing protein [Burkholderiales bacterium]|nr:PEP-CTERM sorting domain-containing protein [Burkholderiales bacterium]